jgi:hypothetical protein
MAKMKPSVRPSETYSAPNFLRVYTTSRPELRTERLATIEHLSYRPQADIKSGRDAWSCATIVDGEAMTKEDAMFIAHNYAIEHEVPVIYECHNDETPN